MSTVPINGPVFKLHPDDEGVDRIEIQVVPRYKTSGLSGDEWRVSAEIVAFRKGKEVGRKTFSRMEWAAAALPYLWNTAAEWCEGPLYDGAVRGLCQQAGCLLPAIVTYRIKKEYSARGEGPLPPSTLISLRRFCAAHKTRGDCGREDADGNYETVHGETECARAALKGA